ncbi:MAG: ABC transporter ATP-binding protein, partial [Thermomicrobiales bacterium]|nr:ABC transporter ATP-binding protein [Thermomicrobiales bacterium]
LSDFDGTILFVSHDRYFIDRIATRIWEIADGSIKQYRGNYTDYQRQLGHRQDSPPPKEKEKAPEPAPTPVAVATATPPRSLKSEAKAQKALLQVERDIARLEGKLNEVSDALTVASIDADMDAVARLGAEYDRLQNEVEGAYTRWEELSAQLAELTAATG